MTGTSASYSPSLPDTKAWHASVDALRRSVQRWTGHPLHAVELSTWQWFKLPTSDPTLCDDIRRHGIAVAGAPNLPMVPACASSSPLIRRSPSIGASRGPLIAKTHPNNVLLRARKRGLWRSRQERDSVGQVAANGELVARKRASMTAVISWGTGSSDGASTPSPGPPALATLPAMARNTRGLSPLPARRPTSATCSTEVSDPPSARVVPCLRLPELRVG